MFTGRVGVMTVIGTWALRTAPTKPISYAERALYCYKNRIRLNIKEGHI